MEMELLNHPQAINTIKFNILMASNRIKEVEILTMRENKTMLVLLDLTWIGRKFFKTRIFSEVEEILTQLLPSFRFRVIDDPEIMKLAVERVKQALTGGKNENALNPSNVPSPDNTQQQIIPETAAPTEAQQGAVESSVPGGEEQPEVGQDVPNGTSTNDPEEK